MKKKEISNISFIILLIVIFGIKNKGMFVFIVLKYRWMYLKSFSLMEEGDIVY